MEVTPGLLAPFEGGQAQIQNSSKRYLLRGEIGLIGVVDGMFTISFVWLAQGEGFPDSLPRWRWTQREQFHYESSPQTMVAMCIGKDSAGCDRLALHNSITNDLVVLFSPAGDKLSRSEVEGLEPPTP